MDNRVNLKSYEGVESVQLALKSEKELNAYVQEKMKSAEDDAEFIKSFFPDKVRIDVCEIGCGNGKLLYQLEKAGILREGVGYETAESRVAMARKMGGILNINCVEIRNQDFLSSPIDKTYKLIVLVDIVFQMISPLFDGAEAKALNWIYKSLGTDGNVFFEIEDFSVLFGETVRNEQKEWRRWEEFPASDPFQWGLYKVKKDVDGNLIFEKTFLRRDGTGKESFCNVLKPYKKQEFVDLLAQYGFKAEIYDYYSTKEKRVEAMKNGTYKESLFRVWAKKA